MNEDKGQMNIIRKIEMANAFNVIYNRRFVLYMQEFIACSNSEPTEFHMKYYHHFLFLYLIEEAIVDRNWK
jgi:hypothetical protein